MNVFPSMVHSSSIYKSWGCGSLDSRNLEPHPGLPCRRQESKYLSHHLLPPRCTWAGKQNETGVAGTQIKHPDMGCRHPKASLPHRTPASTLLHLLFKQESLKLSLLSCHSGWALGSHWVHSFTQIFRRQFVCAKCVQAQDHAGRGISEPGTALRCSTVCQGDGKVSDSNEIHTTLRSYCSCWLNVSWRLLICPPVGQALYTQAQALE